MVFEIAIHLFPWWWRCIPCFAWHDVSNSCTSHILQMQVLASCRQPQPLLRRVLLSVEELLVDAFHRQFVRAFELIVKMLSKSSALLRKCLKTWLKYAVSSFLELNGIPDFQFCLSKFRFVKHSLRRQVCPIVLFDSFAQCYCLGTKQFYVHALVRDVLFFLIF